MGFGISGILRAATKAALIQWVDPDAEPMEEEEQSLLQSVASTAAKMATTALVGNLARNEITPDVRKGETHKYSSMVTETAMEDGSVISQHIIQKPIEISLQFEETNAGKTLAKVLDALGVIETTPTFDKLVDIWKRKIPVKIITEQASYDNMVIENMPIMHSKPYKGTLKIMVDFKQLSLVSVYGDQYKASDKKIEKAISKTVEGGQQIAQKVQGS